MGDRMSNEQNFIIWPGEGEINIECVNDEEMLEWFQGMSGEEREGMTFLTKEEFFQETDPTKWKTDGCLVIRGRIVIPTPVMVMVTDEAPEKEEEIEYEAPMDLIELLSTYEGN
jgi:hypothetical protein